MSGRVAIVTGGGSGLGAAIAERLGLLGSAVGILDLDGSAAEQVVARLGSVSCLAVQADVADGDSVELAFTTTSQRLGPIDILVNNAGVASYAPIWELTREEWDHTLGVDLSGVFSCSKMVIPDMMRRRTGCIVNIASLSGKRGGGIKNTSAYAAAKAGVLGFTKALARELAPFGIRVNAIAPGQFETPMADFLRTEPDTRARVLETIPLRRFGQPDEIAGAVAFLVGDDASYVTGETINVDGGLLME